MKLVYNAEGKTVEVYEYVNDFSVPLFHKTLHVREAPEDFSLLQVWVVNNDGTQTLLGEFPQR